MSHTLKGRVALVTGASSGIGESTAIALAAAGAKVALSARREDRLKALAQKIADAGGEAIAIVGDVTDEAAAQGAVVQTLQQLGRLDILINSAGGMQPGSIADADLALWRNLMELNFYGTLYTCSAAIRHMRAQGGGDIVNISSTAGRRATGILAPYCASKFALTAMTECMRQEVGNSGIRVCIIEPGATKTEISDHVVDENFRGTLREHVSKPGAMSAQDVAAAVLFVVSLPPRANVSEILIRPTIDVAPI